MRFFLLLSFAFAAHAQGFDHAHKAWDALLKKHVVLIDGGRASQVRYAGMAQERSSLKKYLESLSRVSEAEFTAWTKAQQMAFLINAYNAFTVEKILTRYPDIKSIWDFGKLFGNPFRDPFFFLLGRKMSLDGVEHGTLRKHYQEPRVHYAVNCASIGCPMLREEAYVGERLEVSEIFKWFREDWESGYQGIQSREQHFSKYAELLADRPEHRKLISGEKAAIAHLEYDWSLNDFRSSSPR